jgi:DNA-binding NtrC family response regulator
MLRERHYDVILLDLRLPMTSGLWFLRNADIPSDTRVIAMSTFAPRSLLRQIEALGVCDFLMKPFDTDELMYSLECSAAHQVDRHEETDLPPPIRAAAVA